MGSALGTSVRAPQRDISGEFRQTMRGMEQIEDRAGALEGRQLGLTMGHLAEFGPQFREASLAATPERAGVLNRLYGDAMEGLEAGASLTPRETRDVTQSAREGMAARGRVGDNLGIFSEAMARHGMGDQRQRERQQFAANVAGLDASLTPDPTGFIAGRSGTLMPGFFNQAGQAHAQQFSADAQAAAQQAQHRAGLTGAVIGGGLGAAGMYMLSDMRLKTDMKPTGRKRSGIPEYEYRYSWDPEGTKRTGVMAQDVARVKPSAVAPVSFTALAVDYSQI